MTETAAGGELTVDHFRPSARGGTDDPGNLLYSCQRCNGYKADYWSAAPHEPRLWNPRQEPPAAHWLPLANGTRYPLTDVGAFTSGCLWLSRPPLVAHRRQRHPELPWSQIIAMRNIWSIATSGSMWQRSGIRLPATCPTCNA